LPKKTGSAEPGCKGKHSFGSGKRFEKKFSLFSLRISPAAPTPPATISPKEPSQSGCKDNASSNNFPNISTGFFEEK